MTVLTLLDKLIKAVEEYEVEEGLTIFRHDIMVSTATARIYLTIYTLDENSFTDRFNDLRSHIGRKYPLQCSGFHDLDGYIMPIVNGKFAQVPNEVTYHAIGNSGDLLEITETITDCTDTVTQEV